MTPAEAIKIIGTQAEADYVLQPSKQADQYEATAPALAALLRSGKVSTIAGEYQHRDGQALSAQRNYETPMEWANRAIFATAVLSALTMATQILSGPAGFWAVATFGILSALAGASAAMWL